MKKIKMLFLLLSIFVIMFLMTGCIHFKFGFEINSDNTGKITAITAFPNGLEDEDGQYSTEIEVPEGYKGEIKVSSSPITYEEDDSIYNGTKVEAVVTDMTSYITSNEEMRLIELPNGVKRLEMDLTKKVSDGLEEEKDPLNILSIFETTHGKMLFTIKIDYKVISHNATSVEGNVYTWDLLKLILENNDINKAIENIYIEYDTTKINLIEDKPVIKSFNDVSTSHWAYKDIMTLVGKGIISGVTAPDANGVGKYSPSDTVSLGQFLAISTRLVASDYIRPINSSHWAAQNYVAAIESGLISSRDFDSTVESLNGGISREDMAYILVNVAKANGEVLTIKDGIKNNIKDFDSISKSRQDAVLKAYSNGLLVGDNNGNFNPKKILSRDAVAAVFCRVMNYTIRPTVEVKTP